MSCDVVTFKILRSLPVEYTLVIEVAKSQPPSCSKRCSIFISSETFFAQMVFFTRVGKEICNLMYGWKPPLEREEKVNWFSV